MGQSGAARRVLVVVAALCGAMFLLSACGSSSEQSSSTEQFTYTARTGGGSIPTGEELDQAVTVLVRRLDVLFDDCDVERSGEDAIAVTTRGVSDAQAALAALTVRGELGFFDDGASRVSGPAASVAAAIEAARQQPLVPLSAGVQTQLDQLAATGATEDLLLVHTAKGVPGGAAGSPAYFVYLNDPRMTGDAVASARATSDRAGLPTVEVEFTDTGRRQFEEFTRDIARAGVIQGVPQTFAVVLDGILESDPLIDPYENPGGIAGGKATITGNFTQDEADRLAAVLSGGKLPVQLVPRD
jgi:preprotein translocase subunit SecD